MLSGVQSWSDLGGNPSRMESLTRHADSGPNPGRVSRAPVSRRATPISTTVPRRNPISNATNSTTGLNHPSTSGSNSNTPTSLQAGRPPPPSKVDTTSSFSNRLLYTPDPSEFHKEAALRRASGKAGYGVSNPTGHVGAYPHQVPSKQPSHRSLSQISSEQPGNQSSVTIGPNSSASFVGPNGRVPSISVRSPGEINQSHASDPRPASTTGGGRSSWGSGWSKALEKPSRQVHSPVISGAKSLERNTKALIEPSYVPYNPSQLNNVSPGLSTNMEGTQNPSNELHKRNLVAAQVSPQQNARKIESGVSTSVNPARKASESVQTAFNTPIPNGVQRALKSTGQNIDQGRPLGHQIPRQGEPLQAPQTPRLQHASSPSMPVRRINLAESVPRQTVYGSQQVARQPLESSNPFQTPAKQQTTSFTRGSSQLRGPTAKRQPTSGSIVEHSEESARTPIVQAALSTSQPSSMVASQQRAAQTTPSQREANNVKQTAPHESKLHHLKDLAEKKISGEFQHLKEVLKPNHKGAAAAPSNGPSPRRASPPQSVAGGAIPGSQAKEEGTGNLNLTTAPPRPAAKSAPVPQQHGAMREGNLSKPAGALGAGSRNTPSELTPQTQRKDEHGAKPLRLANAPGPATRNAEKSPLAAQPKSKSSAAQPTQAAKLGQNLPRNTKAPATGSDACTKSTNPPRYQSKPHGVEQNAASLGSKNSKSEAKAPQGRSLERLQREARHGDTDFSKPQNTKPEESVQKSDEYPKSQNAKPKEPGHADKAHQGEAKPHSEKPKPKARRTGSSSKAESNRPRSLSVASVSDRSERGLSKDREEDEDDSKRLSRSLSRESARSGENGGRDLSGGPGNGGEEPRYDEWEDGALNEDATMVILGYNQRDMGESAWTEQPDFASNINMYLDAPMVDYDGNDYPPFNEGGEPSGIEDRGLGDTRYGDEQEDKETGNADEWNNYAGDDRLNDDIEGAGIDGENRRLGWEPNENDTETAHPEYSNDAEREDQFNDDYGDPDNRSFYKNPDLEDRDDADYPEPERQSNEDYPGFENQSYEMPEQEEMYFNGQGINKFSNNYDTEDFEGQDLEEQDFERQTFGREDDVQYQQSYEDQGAAGGFGNSEVRFDELRGEFEAAEQLFENEAEQIQEDLEQYKVYEEQQREDAEQEREDVEQWREDREQEREDEEQDREDEEQERENEEQEEQEGGYQDEEESYN